MHRQHFSSWHKRLRHWLVGAFCLVLLLGGGMLPGLTEVPWRQSLSQPVVNPPAADVPGAAPDIADPALVMAPTWQPAQGAWTPIAPHREDRGSIKVVWLQGTPYEMGWQHGRLLHDEIASLGPEILRLLKFAGRGLALGRLAAHRTFPDMVAECRGLTAATEDIGMTIEGCLGLAFGDVYQEFLGYLVPNLLFNEGCTNFAAAGTATIDGELYHGRSLDNNTRPIDYWIKHTTVFVRQPHDGIPHVHITVPGMIWPNDGLNAEGITISLDTAHPATIEDLSLAGVSNVQLKAQVMKYAHTYTEAKALIAAHERMRANLILITDGHSQQAGVLELLGQEMGVRELDGDGTLYMTNHFLAETTMGRDAPPTASSLSRYQRLQQVLEPEGMASRYGKLDPRVIVEILRDRTNPTTLTASPLEVFDDDASIGGNGSLRQLVFDPKRLQFWIATGKVPIPENPFICFSLGDLLNLPGAPRCDAPAIE